MSAATMRRLVKLARAKKEKKEREEEQRSRKLSSLETLIHNVNSNRHHKGLTLPSNIVRTTTSTNVRTTPKTAEQKVAHRLSITMQNAPLALHVRSYSDPEKLKTMTTETLKKEIDENYTNHSEEEDDEEDDKDEEANDNENNSFPNGNELLSIDSNTNSNHQEIINGNCEEDNCEEDEDGSSVSTSESSDLDSEDVNIKRNKFVPPSLEPELMNKQKSKPKAKIIAPSLDKLDETNTLHSIETLRGFGDSSAHLDISSINGNNNNTNIDNYNNNNNINDTKKNKKKTNKNTSSSFWSKLCCCSGSSSLSSIDNDTNNSYNKSISQLKDEPIERKKVKKDLGLSLTITSDTDKSSSDNLFLVIPDDDWKTVTSVSRLRRPTAYSTATHNKESTINADDIRMWDEPFGKGASGRVYKAVYLPLCQIMAVKVTSRLDKLNVKQLLEEFDSQQQLLPDCDQLMRIFGWYRDMEQNSVVVALEYMDMGSIFDSCFPKNKSSINQSPEEHEKSGHKQILVDKLTYDQIRYIARESLLGLHSLHNNEQPLIHRDIKPHNILLSSTGEVKIADFGLLIQLKSKNELCTQIQGTQKYFAPERIKKQFGTGVDIWALGISLIEIYKQELIPPDELSHFEISEQGIDINEFLPVNTPTEFIDFLKKCLIYDYKKRPSAYELLQHSFITRKWGNPLSNEPNFNKKKHVTFSEINSDQKLLEKILGWLEGWILFDEDHNAKLFENGDAEFLRQCVCNLARYSGLPPKYIDTFIADVYRELINSH